MLEDSSAEVRRWRSPLASPPEVTSLGIAAVVVVVIVVGLWAIISAAEFQQEAEFRNAIKPTTWNRIEEYISGITFIARVVFVGSVGAELLLLLLLLSFFKFSAT